MIKRCRQWSIIAVMGVLLLSVLTANAKKIKAFEEKEWDITFKGDGKEPFFQSSVEMEINLRGFSTKEDVTVFINKEKWEGGWDYDRSLKITFREEGSYEIHIIHRDGYEEKRKIIVELSNPGAPKIDTRSYSPGTWTNTNIELLAYGSKAASKILHYEYKIGNGEWNIMDHDRLALKDDMDDEVFIRSVSNAGREGEITKVWCRIWKKTPNLPKISCDVNSGNGWYQKIPYFEYETQQMENGPVVHTYASLTRLETNQTQTEIDKIPKIRSDGRYLLKIWSKDEALNRSKEIFQLVCFVDTKAPEIFVEYDNISNIHGILKSQKAKIKVRDENLLKTSLRIKTSGKQNMRWKQEGEYYQTEVIFDRDGKQNLSIQAEDMAGNVSIKKEKQFVIDTEKPQIRIEGVVNGKSYKNPVSFDAVIKDENLDSEKTCIYVNGKRSKDTTINKDGYYTIEIEACDLAGNENRMTKRFIVNQKGIDIHFLQADLKEKNISTRNLKPGFRVTSLEPVKVTEFLVNGQKVPYEWEGDRVYVKEPIADNGRCTISLSVKDAAGSTRSSENITFFYDTKNPVIKILGLDKNNECAYGKEVAVSLENEKDGWKEVSLDGKQVKELRNKISFKNLEPGIHVLDLEAYDLAGNKTRKKVRFKVTKILPEPIKKILGKDSNEKKETKEQEKIPEAYAEAITFILAAALLFAIGYKKRLKP